MDLKRTGRGLITGFFVLFLFSGCGPTRRDWKEAEKRHTILGYERFLEKYGRTALADSAVIRIRRLYYEEAVGLDILPAYEAFLALYPRGALADSARLRIESIRFGEARRKHRIPAYSDFIRTHPNSPRAAEARRAVDSLMAARKPEYRDIHRVGIFLDERYEGPFGPLRGIHPGFVETAGRILEACGLTVVPQESDAFDAVLTIHARGVISDVDSVTSDAVLYGVEAGLSGAFTFRFGGEGQITDVFSSGKAWLDNRSTRGADAVKIFETLFWRSGSFAAALADLAAREFGPAGLVGLMAGQDSLAVRLEELFVRIGNPVRSDLERAVRYGDLSLRRPAVRGLGLIGTDKADSLLVPLLGTPDAVLRNTVIEALGRLGSPKGIPRITPFVNHRDADTRYAAAVALGLIGGRETSEPLRSLLDDPVQRVAFAAVTALGLNRDSTAVDNLIRIFDGEEEPIKILVMEALAQIGTAAEPALLAGLRTGSNRMRWRCAKVLGRLRSEPAIPDLARALGDHNSFLVWTAKDVLSEYGLPALEAVLEAVADDTTREKALVVLGSIDDPRSYDVLVRYLNDADLDASRSAAEGLGILGRREAVPHLLEALDRGDLILTLKSLMALREIADPAVFPRMKRLMDTDDFAVRLHTMNVLGALETREARDVILAELDSLPTDLLIRAVEILGENPDEGTIRRLIPLCAHISPILRRKTPPVLMRHRILAAGPLLEAFRTGPREVRREAAVLLGRIRESRAIPDLIRSLDSEDEYLTNAAKTALYQIQGPAVMPLVEALGHSSARIRLRAAEALEQVTDPRVLAPMIRALEGRDARLSAVAAKNLGEFGDDAAVPSLIRALGRSHMPLRVNAADALGRIGERDAVDALLALLDAEEAEVRSAAATALGRIGDQAAIEPLTRRLADPDILVRRAAGTSLAGFGEPAVRPLVRVLTNASPAERLEAAGLLARIGFPAVPELIPLLRSGDTLSIWYALLAVHGIRDLRAAPALAEGLPENNRFLFMSIRQAFVNIGRPAAPFLIPLLSRPDPYTRWAAVETLGFIKDPASTPFIPPLLSDPDPIVREAAAKALRKMSRKDFGMNRRKWEKWVAGN